MPIDLVFCDLFLYHALLGERHILKGSGPLAAHLQAPTARFYSTAVTAARKFLFR